MLAKSLRIGALLLAGLFAAAGLARPARAAERQRPPCWYTIRRGDELGKISRRFYGSVVYWKEIEKVNPGINPRRLKIGARIWIPRLGEPSRPPSPPSPTPPSPPPTPPTPPPVSTRPGPPERSAAEGEPRGVRWLFAWFAGESWWEAVVRIAGVYAFLSFWLWVASRMLRRVLGLRHTEPMAALFGGFLSLLAAAVIGYGVHVLLQGAFGGHEYNFLMNLIWGVLFLIVWSAVASLLLGHNYGVSPVAGAVTFVFWFALWSFAGGVLLIAMVLIRAAT